MIRSDELQKDIRHLSDNEWLVYHELAYRAFANVPPVVIQRIPFYLKREGMGWVTIFNKDVPKELDIRLLISIQVELGWEVRVENWRLRMNFSPDGTMIAIGGTNEALVFDIETGTQIVTLDHSHMNSVLGVNALFDLTGSSIVTWSSSYVRAWNTSIWTSANWQHVEDGNNIIHVTWTASMLAIVIDNGIVVWVDADTGKHVRTTEAADPNTVLTCVTMSRDGRYWLIGGDTMYRVWRTNGSGASTTYADAHESPISCCEFSSTGDIFTGSEDGILKVWRVDIDNDCGGIDEVTTDCVRELERPNSKVIEAKLSSDLKWILCAYSDGVVVFWTNGEENDSPYMILRTPSDACTARLQSQR
jgi:WD domain, G-beta repeat